MRPKKKILCAITDEDNRSILAFLLETHGYRVYAVGSAAEAQQVVCGGTIDLALVDVDLPDLNGNTFVLRMKTAAPHIPAVLLHGAQEPPAGFVCSADALVPQGCTAASLLECVKQKSARKRGPRKGYIPAHAFLKKQASAEAPVAEATRRSA